MLYFDHQTHLPISARTLPPGGTRNTFNIGGEADLPLQKGWGEGGKYSPSSYSNSNTASLDFLE